MAGRDEQFRVLGDRYPTISALVPRARRRLPPFAYDFMMGGTGDELGYHRNTNALAAIEIVPRYGEGLAKAAPQAKLLGQDFTMPVVIAPVGMDGAIWPGATAALTRAARDAGIPYMTGTLANGSLESVAEGHPGGTWFQLYTMPDNDHRVSLDLLARADRAGVKVLAVTLDIPLPGRRVRDMRNGIRMPFRITPKMMFQAATRPGWLRALAREGQPRFANMAPYCAAGAGKVELENFVRQAAPGNDSTWDALKRIRAAWPHTLLVKGLLHPEDARRAIKAGADGVIVSNHGGRQFDPAPAPIDVLPAIRAELGPKATILMDGGILSGLDVLKALALGADGVLAGRAFMIGLAALGPAGATHVANIFKDELRIGLAQTGAINTAGARKLALRHPGRWQPEEFTRSDAAPTRIKLKTKGTDNEIR